MVMAAWKGWSVFAVLACKQGLHYGAPRIHISLHSCLLWRAALDDFSRLPQMESLLTGYRGIRNVNVN